MTSADFASWNPDAALRRVPISFDWVGRAWRFHRRDRLATDTGGAVRFSGRFNRGLDVFPEADVWPVLYLTLAPEVALGERQRHLTMERLARFNDYRLTTLEVRLRCVIDCTDLDLLGISHTQLCDDYDYAFGQRLAEAARGLMVTPAEDQLQTQAISVEAMIVPSATLLGNNLIVFPDRLDPSSTISVVEYIDPRLYVESSSP